MLAYGTYIAILSTKPGECLGMLVADWLKNGPDFWSIFDSRLCACVEARFEEETADIEGNVYLFSDNKSADYTCEYF